MRSRTPAWRANCARSLPTCRPRSPPADLVVCRSGAGTVSELAAAGKPSILVPFPFAADDHQTRNAEAMVHGGAARMIADSEISTASGWCDLLEELTGSSWSGWRQAARRLARPGAAARAAEILEEESSAANRDNSFDS